MEDSRPVKTPMVKEKGTEEETENKTYPCREAVGSLLYLSTKTRPDLSFSVNKCSRYVDKPSDHLLINIKRIYRYLNGTRDQGITYKADAKDDELIAFCDSDFGEDYETRKSTTGFLIMYIGGPISWCSRLQRILALSTTEAEYIAASECCRELQQLKNLIEELTNKTVKTTLYIDNQSTISFIRNGITNRRSKHIDLKYRHIITAVKEKQISVKYRPTDEQTADIMTKPLDRIKFEKHKAEIVS